MSNVNEAVKLLLDESVGKIEVMLNADVMSISAPIRHGLEHQAREAIRSVNHKKTRIAIILTTGGGVVEVVERMVNTIRNAYEYVTFIVPDRAMSAGTIFVMSGDAIMMSDFSCLGPIDPQIERDGRLIPALSYLIQYERMIKKAKEGELTDADMVLLGKLDLAELHQFEQAKALSITLLRRWLANYKFKDWKTTKGQGSPVTNEMKERRAEEIANMLSDPTRWHSHGRGIGMATLLEDVNLLIDDIGKVEGLLHSVEDYCWLLEDFRIQRKLNSFVHTRGYF